MEPLLKSLLIFYRHERNGGEALEVEDELSSLFFEFLDPPLERTIFYQFTISL
jgi:hypothetical protein